MCAMTIKKNFLEKLLYYVDANCYNIEYLINARYLFRYFLDINLFHFSTPMKEILLFIPILWRLILNRVGGMSKDLSACGIKLEPSHLVPELYCFSYWNE